MEGYGDPDSIAQQQADIEPTGEHSEGIDMARVEITEELVVSEKRRVNPRTIRTLKAVVIRAIMALVAFACLTGYAQQVGNRVMGPVIEYDQRYLEKTLKNLAGSIFLLSGPKAVMELAQTAEIEPEGYSVKLGSIQIGEILEPYLHIVDDIWDFLIFSTYLVIAQISALKMIGLLSVKFFLGLGTLCCAIQYRRNTVFGKVGLTLIFLFVMTYVFYPLTVGMAAQTYEQHQVQTSIELSENLGVLKEKASDIELFSVKNFKETVKSIPEVLGQGLRTVWDATWGLVVGLILMFVLLPLLTLGTIYLIGRQVMLYLDMPTGVEHMDAAGRRVLDKIGSRTRSKLALSRG